MSESIQIITAVEITQAEKEQYDEIVEALKKLGRSLTIAEINIFPPTEKTELMLNGIKFIDCLK
jgi:hypothetical protein